MNATTNQVFIYIVIGQTIDARNGFEILTAFTWNFHPFSDGNFGGIGGGGGGAESEFSPRHTFSSTLSYVERAAQNLEI